MDQSFFILVVLVAVAVDAEHLRGSVINRDQIWRRATVIFVVSVDHATLLVWQQPLDVDFEYGAQPVLVVGRGVLALDLVVSLLAGCLVWVSDDRDAVDVPVHAGAYTVGERVLVDELNVRLTVTLVVVRGSPGEEDFIN